MDNYNSEFVSKEDYEEPCCPLKMGPSVNPIPVSRVIAKLDEHLNRNDYSEAEKLLKYWYDEAVACNDSAGLLTVLNEQVGLYRKLGKKEECINTVKKCMSLAQSEDFQDTVSFCTTLLNCATGYSAFDMAQKALPLYERAKVGYEKHLKENDERLGGLYNNMAICLMKLKKFEEAKALYENALNIMATAHNREPEMAVTYCNLADLEAAEHGLEQAQEKIDEYLEKAEELLNTENLPKDGNYAFVCEKCAPTFGYYGYFLTERELRKRAEEIYERN